MTGAKTCRGRLLRPHRAVRSMGSKKQLLGRVSTPCQWHVFAVMAPYDMQPIIAWQSWNSVLSSFWVGVAKRKVPNTGVGGSFRAQVVWATEDHS